MDQRQPRHEMAASRIGPGAMLFSAALFGFFGFVMGPWSTTSVVTGQFLLYVALFNWTLQILAVVFLLCAGLTLMNRALGNATYAIAGLAGAVLFAIIAVMDLADPSTIFTYAPLVLAVLAVWNGYGSWMALRELHVLWKARNSRGASPAGPTFRQTSP